MEQAVSVSKTPFGMPLLGPRIAKVEINSCQLPICKQIPDILHKHMRKPYIVQLCRLRLFQGPENYTVLPFNADKSGLPVQGCLPCQKLPFSAAQFQVQLIGILKKRAPASLPACGIFHHIMLQRLQPLFHILCFSLSHCFLPVLSFLFYKNILSSRMTARNAASRIHAARSRL